MVKIKIVNFFQLIGVHPKRSRKRKIRLHSANCTRPFYCTITNRRIVLPTILRASEQNELLNFNNAMPHITIMSVYKYVRVNNACGWWFSTGPPGECFFAYSVIAIFSSFFSRFFRLRFSVFFPMIQRDRCMCNYNAVLAYPMHT